MRWTHSPGGVSLARSGVFRCRNPVRVVPSAARLAECGGWGQAEAEWYSEVPARRVARPAVWSAWEESGRNPGSGCGWHALGGWSPREHPAVATLIMRRSPGTPGRVKAQKPRPVGPAHRLGEGITDGLNGMWVHRSRKRGRNLPRGESSEG